MSLVEEVDTGGPGFGCASPEHSKSITSQIVKVEHGRVLKIRSVNWAFDFALVPGNKRL